MLKSVVLSLLNGHLDCSHLIVVNLYRFALFVQEAQCFTCFMMDEDVRY